MKKVMFICFLMVCIIICSINIVDAQNKKGATCSLNSEEKEKMNAFIDGFFEDQAKYGPTTSMVYIASTKQCHDKGEPGGLIIWTVGRELIRDQISCAATRREQIDLQRQLQMIDMVGSRLLTAIKKVISFPETSSDDKEYLKDVINCKMAIVKQLYLSDSRRVTCR